MLSKKIFTQEYISELRGRTGDDPLMIERTLFAFFQNYTVLLIVAV